MIAITVPAHNEEERIGACPRSSQIAAQDARLGGEDLWVVVVLDSCTDQTDVLVRSSCVHSVAISACNVGKARATGSQLALDRGARWLLHTDADSVVAPDWVLAHVSQSAGVVCGTVAVEDWSEYDARLPVHFGLTCRDVDGHSHIHGANLDVRAEPYRTVGGFSGLASSEDVDLIEMVKRQGFSVCWSAAPRVTTSARRSDREQAGFVATMDHIHQQGSHVLG